MWRKRKPSYTVDGNATWYSHYGEQSGNSFSISKTLSDINQSRILSDPPPRVMEIKAKINKWDLINLKRFAQRRTL